MKKKNKQKKRAPKTLDVSKEPKKLILLIKGKPIYHREIFH